MTLKKRKTLYFLSVALFVLVGTYLVLTVQGIVFDPETFSFSQMGGIYLQSSPIDIDIHIGGIPYEPSPGILDRGSLFKNLAPQQYSVRLEREGYHAWEKTLTVNPGMVTPVSGIILWKKSNPETVIATSSISNFWNTQEGLVLQKEEGLVFQDQSIKGDEMVLHDPRFPAIITRNDSAIFYTNLSTPETSINIEELFTSLQKRAGYTQEPIREILFHPFSSSRIFLVTDHRIYTLDMDRVLLEGIAETTEPIQATALSRQEILFADTGGTIASYNLILNTSSEIVNISSSTPTRFLETDGSAENIFFTQGKSLFWFNRSLGTSTIISQDAYGVIIGSDGVRAAILSEHEPVTVLYLARTIRDIVIPQGTTVEIPEIVAPEDSFMWNPRFFNYAFIAKNDDLAVYEIDTRLPLNKAILSSGFLKIRCRGSCFVLDRDGTLRELRIGED